MNKSSTFFFLLAVLVSWHVAAQSAYNTTPDWTTQPENDVSTGLGLADINGDGSKDMVIANGNDISRQHLVVYYNDGEGNFNSTPDWESDDIDYHGHLSCGDIDSDGDTDVAVSVYIGEAGFDEPGELKVYYNTGNQLESSPSFVSEPFYTFSCALGDADGDGDLDLATVAGEPYDGILDKGKVYYNDDGIFSDENVWESDLEMGALDVAFGDFDLNGYQDLVFACEGTPNYIYLADNSGNISTAPSWASNDENNYVNSVEVGYETAYGDTIPYIVMTENDQLGGQGRVKRYDFPAFPADSVPSWTSPSFGYGSGIKLGFSYDNAQFTKTIYYGGWWLPVEARLIDENGFQEPYYTTETSSVVEAIETADLDKAMMETETIGYTNEQDHAVAAIQLYNPNIETIESVTAGGSGNEIAFSYVYGESWISLHEPLQPGNSIEISYKASPTPDMVISNWDNVGNYIFYNTYNATAVNSQKFAHSPEVFPNPARKKLFVKPAIKANYEITIKSSSGRTVYKTQVSDSDKNSHAIDIDDFAPGVYILTIKHPNHTPDSRQLVIQ